MLQLYVADSDMRMALVSFLSLIVCTMQLLMQLALSDRLIRPPRIRGSMLPLPTVILEHFMGTLYLILFVTTVVIL
jgi:hypothetical protein